MLDSTRALARGFWTTLKHMARPPVTVTYPERKRPVFPRFRGRHRLYRTEDGLERCIGCELCAAACPAQAIRVVAADNDPANPVSPGERYAAVYEINMLRCIFCGYCEEACPVDAIKLGPEYELADSTRSSLIYTKPMLLNPEQYAPRRQYHPDVDRPRQFTIPPSQDLDRVYRTYKPAGAGGSRRHDGHINSTVDEEARQRAVPADEH